MSVILVTGTPGTGKTTVSKSLSERLSIPLVAVNDLVEENTFTMVTILKRVTKKLIWKVFPRN